MANQRTDTQSVINLVINGRQAMSSLREITDTQRRLNAEMRNMRPSNPQYPARLRELQMINRAMEEQRDELRGINEETSKWKDITAGILTADIFKQAADWIGNAVSKIKDAYKETEKFRAILTVAFNGNADLAESSLKMLSDFAAKTPFQLNEATGAFIKLVNRGFIPTQNEMIKMGDLASSQGKSFDQYVEALLDAQTGEFERLKEFGIKASKNGDQVSLSFKGMTQEVQNTDSAIRNAMLAFGAMDGVKGSMEAVSQTVEGLESNIEDTWSQIFTSIGKSSSGMINGFYKSYGGLLSWFKEKFVDVGLSEQMEKDRFELVKLEMQIQSVNTKQEDRIKIINKLKEQYPDYFANINAEKLNINELTLAFKKLNSEYLNKIVLQKQNENLAKSEDERANTKLRQFQAEAELRDYLARIKDKNPSVTLYGQNDIDKARTLLMQLQSHGDKAFQGISRFAKNDLKNLLSDYDYLDNRFLEQTAATTKIMTERQRLAKSLGINPDQDLTIKTNTAPIQPKDAPKKVDAKTAESEKKKALQEFEKLDKEYEKLGIKALDDQLSKNQREVEQEERKYEELLKKEREFLTMKGATKDQLKSTQEKISQIEADKDTALGNLRIRQEKELTQKILELRTNLTNAHETELQKQSDNINKFYDQLERDNVGNENAIAQLKIERQKEHGNAELREKERLEEEKKKIEADSIVINSVDDEEAKTAKIKQKYDEQITALKKMFSDKIMATLEFQQAIAQIEKNREAELAASEKLSKEKEKQKKEAIIQMAQEAADATFSIISNNQKAKLDKTLSSFETERQAELSKKNLTEKQKEVINQKYDAKVKEAKIKGWKAEQAASVAQAVVNGALAITKVLSQTGVLAPFAIPAVALGTALQIGVILGQPVPEFYTGVRDHKGGLAWVGDRGPEAVNENGKWWIAQEPTLVDLEKGSDVYTATDTANMMKKKTLGEKIYQSSSYTIDNTAIKKAEMSYRSSSQIPSFSPAAQNTSAAVTGGATSSFDSSNLESKMDEMIIAFQKGMIFNYSGFEKFKAEIDQARSNQQM